MEREKREKEKGKKKEKQVDWPGNVWRKQFPSGCGGETMSSALV